MNIELTDELLNSSLTVRDLPLPADLGRLVHDALEASVVRPRRVPWRVPSAVRLALVAALTLTLVAAGAVWLGNRRNSLIVGPTPTPTSAASATPAPPSPPPTPSATANVPAP